MIISGHPCKLCRLRVNPISISTARFCDSRPIPPGQQSRTDYYQAFGGGLGIPTQVRTIFCAFSLRSRRPVTMPIDIRSQLSPFNLILYRYILCSYLDPIRRSPVCVSFFFFWLLKFLAREARTITTPMMQVSVSGLKGKTVIQTEHVTRAWVVHSESAPW